jgi:hypothetical protein
MNRARKIESFAIPPFRRHSDRIHAVTRAVERVEREHAGRLRRLVLLLGFATVLLIINGLLVVSLS